MSKNLTKFQFLLLSLAVSISLICLNNSNAFAQKSVAEGSLSLNNSKTESNAPALDRPRVVAKNGNNETAKVSPKTALLFQMERQAFELLNLKRAEYGLTPLKWNENIAKMARLHSSDMAENNYFSHRSKSGSMVNDRADLLGLSDWQAIGENIAFNRGYEKPVEFAVEGWMKSVTHRENILNKKWKEAGIGVALAADGSYYFTEVFMLK